MKTLIVNGSPRKHGDTMHIIQKLCTYLEGEVILIHVYDEKVKPCIDCRYCWNHSDCAIKDDMYKMYDLMDTVDNVILSSPIYFADLSGPLLSYVSRLQRYYADRLIRKNPSFSMKRKKGAVILSAGGDGRGIERPVDTARIIFHHIDTKIVGTVSTLNTNTVPAHEDPTVDAQVKKLADQLNRRL